MAGLESRAIALCIKRTAAAISSGPIASVVELTRGRRARRERQLPRDRLARPAPNEPSFALHPREQRQQEGSEPDNEGG